VPLPWVDVRRPWRSGPAIIADGSNGGHGGVAKVTTMAATTVVVLAAVAPLWRLLFLFRLLLLLGGWDGAEDYGLGAEGVVLV
jgi:hypothetical protein